MLVTTAEMAGFNPGIFDAAILEAKQLERAKDEDEHVIRHCNLQTLKQAWTSFVLPEDDTRMIQTLGAYNLTNLCARNALFCGFRQFRPFHGGRMDLWVEACLMRIDEKCTLLRSDEKMPCRKKNTQDLTFTYPSIRNGKALLGAITASQTPCLTNTMFDEMDWISKGCG